MQKHKILGINLSEIKNTPSLFLEKKCSFIFYTIIAYSLFLIAFAAYIIFEKNMADSRKVDPSMINLLVVLIFFIPPYFILFMKFVIYKLIIQIKL